MTKMNNLGEELYKLESSPIAPLKILTVRITYKMLRSFLLQLCRTVSAGNGVAQVQASPLSIAAGGGTVRSATSR